MKIGFLNPWMLAAENQAFCSLRIAAERIGHQMVHCANSDDIDLHTPAFVLASASTQPKLSDVPHYGVIHEPRDRFLANPKYFENLLTYDGYLTVSDTLQKFLADVTCGIGRLRPIGFYYNTCQWQEASADLDALIARHALRITYFGTNWDKRRESFFRLLSKAEGVEICGPAHSWPQISPNAYGGSIPFDGSGVQRRYATNGIGLCMLSSLHLQDDIISNRIFEITSVGAIALCCDIPWIRNNFGDSVYYFDQDLPDQELCRTILKLRDVIYSNPVVAIEKAKHARQIFESRFTAEIMVESAIKYHTSMCSARASVLQSAEQFYSPFISVITRCGSQPLEYVQRAVQSVANQTYGQFEVLLVRHRNLDVTAVTQPKYPRIRSFQVVDVIGGNRSASLWAGLRLVRGEYFAVLDDDDWWFSTHFEQLFRPLPKSPQEHFFAYSGTIVERRLPSVIEGGAEERREVHSFGITSRESWHAVTSPMASNCFVASTDLLHPELLVDPQMDTAEDSYLVLSLLGQKEPVFSYSATSIFDRVLTNHSEFADHPKRFEDELTLQLRVFGRMRPSLLSNDPWASLAAFWKKRPQPVVSDVVRNARLQGWKQIGGGYDAKKSKVSARSRLLNAKTGAAVVFTPERPWSYGAELFLKRPKRSSSQYLLIAELLVRKGVIGVGVLNTREDDFIFRKSVVESTTAQSIEIPIWEFSEIGRFIVQNWDSPGESNVELLALRVLAEVS